MLSVNKELANNTNKPTRFPRFIFFNIILKFKRLNIFYSADYSKSQTHSCLYHSATSIIINERHQVLALQEMYVY